MRHEEPGNAKPSSPPAHLGPPAAPYGRLGSPPPPAGPPPAIGGPPWSPPPRRSRRGWLAVCVVAALLLYLIPPTLAGSLIWRWVSDTTQSQARTAAEALSHESAVKLSVNYLGTDGTSVAGTFTVTSGRVASGTITDPVKGKADYRATASTAAVRGQADWWAARAPDNVSGLADKWVRPDSGVAFPVPVATALTPAAIASLVRGIAANGTSDGTVDTVAGKQVRTLVSGGWTLLLTDASPHRVVALSGPVTRGALVKPASAVIIPNHVVPAQLGGDSGYQLVQDTTNEPFISMEPQPSDSSGAAKAREDVGKVLPAGPSASPGTSDDSGPPAQADTPVPKPELEAKASGDDCEADYCSVDGSVTNSGDATCEDAEVTITASPAGSQTEPIGSVAPGQTKNATATFKNPAAAGQTVNVSLSATATCVAEVKTDPAVDKRLKKRGINPARSPILTKVDPRYQQTVHSALDLMTGGPDADPGKNSEPDSEQSDKAVKAVEAAVDKRLLPTLKILVDNADRVLNWEDIAGKLLLATRDTVPGSATQPIRTGSVCAGNSNEVRRCSNRIRTPGSSWTARTATTTATPISTPAPRTDAVPTCTT